MNAAWPERRVLMHGETPLTRPTRTAAQLGIDLWIKRDDLTGLAESGNKLRKLEFLVAEAVAQDADTLVTVGGVNSNHARATAVVAARLGLKSHLILRGEDRRPPAGNLLIDKMLGADL
ncbi:MAG: pyridoxal-phosphate dependent enzyme, partial [Myxococcota bacterium]